MAHLQHMTEPTALFPHLESNDLHTVKEFKALIQDNLTSGQSSWIFIMASIFIIHPINMSSICIMSSIFMNFHYVINIHNFSSCHQYSWIFIMSSIFIWPIVSSIFKGDILLRTSLYPQKCNDTQAWKPSLYFDPLALIL